MTRHVTDVVGVRLHQVFFQEMGNLENKSLSSKSFDFIISFSLFSQRGIGSVVALCIGYPKLDLKVKTEVFKLVWFKTVMEKKISINVAPLTAGSKVSMATDSSECLRLS